MFGVIFICLLCIQGFLLIQYLRCLSRISSIGADQQSLIGLTVLESKLTNYILLKDIKFFLCLLTRSYVKSGIEETIKSQLDTARFYLLLQYPVVALLFFTPTFFNHL